MKKISVLLASLLVVACSSTPKTSTSQAPHSSDHQASVVATGSGVASSSPSAKVASKSEVDLGKLIAVELARLAHESDYFDFNKYVVKPAYLTIIKDEADFIKHHKDDFVTLEGNADERGSD